MLAEVRRLLWWTAGGALLVSLLGIALALYLVRRIASSIRALTGPALMYWLLVHVSGIPPLEREMLASRGDAWRAYQASTSAFFPLPPRKP